MEDRDVAELQRLWDLKEKGAISEDEFAQLKAKVLGTNEVAADEQPAVSSDGQPEINQPGRSKFGLDPTMTKVLGGLVVAFLVLLIITSIVSPANTQSGVSTNEQDLNVDENLTNDMNVTTKTRAAPVLPSSTSPKAETVDTSENDQITEDGTGRGNLTPSQFNALRSAEQYLRMTGFSREGLIEQLSSDAGEGYSVSDAAAAVDSLTVDWNENAARSARQYLNMSAFSCQGLIEQLSSPAGDKYTVAQATYGAREAGAC